MHALSAEALGEPEADSRCSTLDNKGFFNEVHNNNIYTEL